MHLKLIITILFLSLNSIESNVIRAVENGENIAESVNIVNNEPIIGILSQEIPPEYKEKYGVPNDSYIAASYVKFVEGSGAMALPIKIGQNKSYYEDILLKVNGVLFPGGDAIFTQSNGYAEAGKYIYTIAKELNRNGDYFPLLGICLGFELLTYLEANSMEHRTNCSSMKQAIPLEFNEDYRESRLFEQVPEDILYILKHDNVTANYHKYCVTPEDLNKVHISKSFRVISKNKDWNGLEFISTLEHTKYPFYGLQFHPEKNSFEWNPTRNIPHGYNATKAGRYFADFFVNEARRNMHKFSNTKEKFEDLIYNYPITYTAPKNMIFLQVYHFN